MSAQAETLKNLVLWFLQYESGYLGTVFEEGLSGQFTPPLPTNANFDQWCIHHPASTYKWIEFLRKEQRLLLEAYSS